MLIGPSDDPNIPFIDNKNQEAGKELTSIMLMKGMRHLALLGGNESYNVTGSRYQGFLDAHHELGIPVDENLIFMNVDNQLVVSEAVSKLYAAGHLLECSDRYSASDRPQNIQGRSIAGTHYL